VNASVVGLFTMPVPRDVEKAFEHYVELARTQVKSDVPRAQVHATLALAYATLLQRDEISSAIDAMRREVAG
jgi:hypothetical protein